MPPVHPTPNDVDLANRPLPVLKQKGPWFRIHRQHQNPIHFGRRHECRFSAPNGEYGVMYASTSLEGAFLETFGRNAGSFSVIESKLAKAKVSIVRARQPLSLVELAAGGLRKIGADQRLISDMDYGLSKSWSYGFYSHSMKPDGLFHPARTNETLPSLALFERCRTAVFAPETHALWDAKYRDEILRIIDKYRFALV